MHSSMDSAISTAAESLGDVLPYQGETLKLPHGYASKFAVVNVVSTLMKKLLARAIKAIGHHFATFTPTLLLVTKLTKGLLCLSCIWL